MIESKKQSVIESKKQSDGEKSVRTKEQSVRVCMMYVWLNENCFCMCRSDGGHQAVQ